MESAETLRRAAAKIRDQWSDESDRGRFNLAVAELLDKEAEGVESGNWRPCVNPALAAARAYLGSA